MPAQPIPQLWHKAGKTSPGAKSDQSKPGSTNSANLAKADQPPSAPKPGDAKADAKSPSKSQPNDPAHQDNKIHLAANAPPPKPKPASPEDPDAVKPPPNNMSKRMLDVAQTCNCQPMKIKVDEWGRSFEGQLRDKLEIAIDPVLKQLDSLLGKAQQLTDDTLAAGRSAEGLSQ